MRVYQIGVPKDIEEFLKSLGVEEMGVKIISNKMKNYFIKIKKLKTPGANILKQEALSVGAEFAVPGGAIVCKSEYVDGLLIANRSQIKILIKKLYIQPFGLSKVAEKLKEIIQDTKFPIRVMGVLNANSDSFYSKVDFKIEKLSKIRLIDEGVDL